MYRYSGPHSYIDAIVVPSTQLKEEYVRETLESLREAGIDFVSGVPDTWLRSVFEALQDDKRFTFVPVSNEGVAFSICAGAWLAGKKPCLLMENSGLRVAAEALSRLSVSDGIPVFILMSYRGSLAETEYFSIGHGKTMEPLLQAFRIPYVVVRKPEDLRKGITGAAKLAFTSQYPAAAALGGELM